MLESKKPMELEGFGASLVGHAIYVVARSEEAWIPWEFISGTPHTCRILVAGNNLTAVEAGNTWTFVIRPTCARDWSLIATIVKGAGSAVLLTFDHDAPVAPAGFIAFLDSVIADGRVVVTRIWIGTHVEIPCIPDALFFPVLRDGTRASTAQKMIARLPARGSHGAAPPLGVTEWNTIVNAATASDLGIVVSDVGEKSWSLFWHKLADSVLDSKQDLCRRGVALVRAGGALLEGAVVGSS
jgi:hypothetical protein